MGTSKSRKKFEENFSDIDSLIDLHETLVHMEKDDELAISDFSDHKYAIVKSSIVLMISHWEAYVEDICSEAIECIVENIDASDELPKELKKKIALEIKEDKNELRVWDLAEGKWKKLLISRLEEYQTQRNWSFNSPKSNQVVEFFNRHLGIVDVSKNWKHNELTPKECKNKLNEIVEVRGAIAHRGHPPRKITIKLAKEYSSFLKAIIAKTGGAVNTHVKNICGFGLF